MQTPVHHDRHLVDGALANWQPMQTPEYRRAVFGASCSGDGSRVNGLQALQLSVRNTAESVAISHATTNERVHQRISHFSCQNDRWSSHRYSVLISSITESQLPVSLISVVDLARVTSSRVWLCRAVATSSTFPNIITKIDGIVFGKASLCNTKKL